MSFVQREIDRINSALCDDPDGSDYALLYAAQQALSWATDPEGFKSPFCQITGIQAEKEDCLGYPDLGQCAHTLYRQS
mgnify:CR=1 FL=1